MRGFLKRIQNTVAEHRLWQAKESFIVGVSGGADSLCLLDILFLLSQKYQFSLYIAHVNYSLRGKNSDLDEMCVKERAKEYNIPLSVLRPPKTSATNLEEKLRDIRYRFFEKLRVQKKATLIAVAHHQDDQAETFLLRLFRGSGISGLSAMQAKNNFVVRPLLEMSRTDILRYLKERGILYRSDESNTDTTYLRNRLRNKLIPLIEKEYQPNIKKILADTAALLARDSALLEEIGFSSERKTLPIEFSVEALLKIPESLLRHKFRLLLRPYYQGKFPSQGTVDEILKVLRSTKSKHQVLKLRGLKLERKGATVRLLNFAS